VRNRASFMIFLGFLSILVTSLATGRDSNDYEKGSDYPLVLNTAQAEPRTRPDETGFQDLIIKEAFRRIQVRVRIVHLPSERALVNANEGIDDGNFVRRAGIEKQYPNLVVVPEKITDFEFAVFTKDPSARINDWADLKPYNVGIITGWKILEENIVGTRSLAKVKDTEALFQMLIHDRVDLMVCDRLQGEWLIQQQGLLGVITVEPMLAKRDMFLYLNRAHAALVPKLAKALQDMKRDGSFERIMNSAHMRVHQQ
jgi:polar amino acid transport system substrate-binding protein